MSKDLLTNEKQYISRIEKAEKRLEKSSKSLLDDCIFLGNELISIKKSIGFGSWGAFLNRNSHFRFATTRMASNYIRIAENSIYAKYFLTDQTSINGIIQGIAEATPEQTDEAKAIKEAEEKKNTEEQAAAKIERERKIAELAAIKEEPEILEGEFTVVKKSTPEPIQEEPDEYISPDEERDMIADEIHSANEDLRKENDYLTKIMSADDQLAKALDELRIQKILNKSLQDSNDQKTNTIARLQKEVQKLQNKIKRFLDIEHFQGVSNG